MKKYLLFLFAILVASSTFGQQEEKKDSGDVKAAAVSKDTASAPAPADASTVKDTVSAAAPVVIKDTATVPPSVAAVAQDSAVVSERKDSVINDTVAVTTMVDSVVTDTLAVDSLAQVADTVALQKDSLAKASKGSSKAVVPAAVVGVAAVAATSGKSSVPNDSLTKVNDSLSNESYKYRVLYSAIKDKVLKRDFDPLRMSYIIDSLAARRDSSFSGIASTSTLLKDSLLASRVEIEDLKGKMKYLNAEETVRDKLISELKQLKVLFDSGILIRSEFDMMKAKVLEKW